MSMFASFARILIASQNSIFSTSIRKVMALPHAPQPKHLNICLSAETVKEGVF